MDFKKYSSLQSQIDNLLLKITSNCFTFKNQIRNKFVEAQGEGFKFEQANKAKKESSRRRRTKNYGRRSAKENMVE